MTVGTSAFESTNFFSLAWKLEELVRVARERQKHTRRRSRRCLLFLNATPALLDEPHVRLAPADRALVDVEEHGRVAAERRRVDRALELALERGDALDVVQR